MKQDINSKSSSSWLTTRSSRSNSKATKSNMYQSSRAVWTGRILFLSCLVAVAATLGILANYILSGSEEELAETQYNSIVDRALVTSKEIVVRKSLGAVSMASVMEVAFPNASTWPYVALNGYELIANNIIATSNGRELAVMPIVRPEQINSFEEFAKDYYTKERIPSFPNQTGNLAGVSSFGFGIFGIDKTLPNTTDQRYRITDGNTSYGSKYNIVLPIIQHSSGAHPVLLLNSHFEKTRGQVLDGVLDCAKRRQMASLNDENKTVYRSINCGGITDFIQLASSKVTPGALITKPIYPYYDDTIMAGMIASSIVWEESLLNCFSSEVSGLDCVVSTHDSVYTYRIEKGAATLKGEGDLHNSKYNRFNRSICLTCGDVFNEEFSAVYTMLVFPTEEFFNVYSTNNPMMATVGAILIIIFTSCLFILYDYFVRREFQSKQDLLKAKRHFMRFVSHEVRTPLNSVSMGLVLLKEEIEIAHRRQVQIEESKNKENESLAGVECHPGDKMKVSIQDVSTSNQVVVQKSVLKIHKNVNADTFEDWLQLTSEIYYNSQAAVAVLSDLLNYDKIETGTLHLELTLLSLWTLLEQTANEFKVPAAQKKIQYDIVVTPIITCSDIEWQSTSTKNSIATSGTTADKRTVDSDSAENYVKVPITTNRTTNRTVSDASKYKAVGDSVRLSQCIRNLISNALKFTPENGKLTIRATWTKLDSNLGNKSKRTGTAQVDTFVLAKGESVAYSCAGIFEMTVTDSGAGMTKEQLGHLFGDGVQFNVNELQGGNGTGLGLHITKGIVEQHNGSITASSDGLGLGTTFAITLPIYDVPQTAANERIRNNLLLASSIKVKNPVDTSDCTVEVSHLRILIVDDATTNRKLLRRLLQNHGHICDEAPDGEVALRIVQDSMETSNVFYDTILMDHEMPVMDGPTSLKKMRDLGCQSLIVGITGNILPEDIAKFKRSGADNVLPKPFHLNDLMNIWVENGLVRTEEIDR